MGAVPASVSGDEQYEALNRGLLDITIASVATGKNYNLWDVAKHITLLPLGTFHSVSPVAFGADFWKGLTNDERSILFQNAVHATVGATRGYFENDQEVLKLATSKGLQIHQPDTAFLAASTAFARKDLEVVEAEASKYGVANAKAKIENLVALVDKWKRLAPPANYDHDALVGLMRSHVYDRIEAAKYGL
jgi:TRAP-type C4-dicarboxylate transport system substrate-binding protein